MSPYKNEIIMEAYRIEKKATFQLKTAIQSCPSSRTHGILIRSGPIDDATDESLPQ